MKKYIRCLSVCILIYCLPFIAASQVIFPVKASTNGRFLVDQNNTPFPILGRTAWCVISQSESSYKTFIENTISHGYNSIEMSVICHWPQSNYPPHYGQGDLPFEKRLNGSVWNGSLVYSSINSRAPDFTTPDDEYWKFVDSFLNYCESKGILVFFFPAYLGYYGTHEGWMNELLANGTEKTKAYWFDPTNGKSSDITGSPFDNQEPWQFTPPGKNSRGQKDWVLKLIATKF